jgi:hypothetical protein
MGSASTYRSPNQVLDQSLLARECVEVPPDYTAFVMWQVAEHLMILFCLLSHYSSILVSFQFSYSAIAIQGSTLVNALKRVVITTTDAYSCLLE